jgi:hypothetical protein
LKVDNRVEGLSVLRGKGDSKGNQANSYSGDKSKYKCFKCHKIVHFKKDCRKLGYKDDFAKFEISSKDCEDVSALMVSSWEKEEGGVSDHENNDTCKLTFM